MKIGIFIGRFQPFHNAHLRDVQKILKRVDTVYIGIGSCQEKRTKENPFSYAERKEMIAQALQDAGIRTYKFFPIHDVHDDELWVNEIERKLGIADKKKDILVFSGNAWTLRCFRKRNYKVRKIRLVKGISSTIVRNLMKKNKRWESLVPKTVRTWLQSGL
jgi:nicotinamide-nucleotide adenylyltransferase